MQVSSAKLCSPGSKKFGSVAPETAEQGCRRLAKRPLKPGPRRGSTGLDLVPTSSNNALSLTSDTHPSVLSHLHHLHRLHRLHHIHANDYWRNARPQRRCYGYYVNGAVCLLRHNGLPRFPIVSGWYGRRVAPTPVSDTNTL